MTDYIKREDVKHVINKSKYYGKKVWYDILDDVYDIPSADVAPVRHGRWVVIDAEEPRRYGCSECKRLSWNMENYCGNCGSRMDGESDDKA